MANGYDPEVDYSGAPLRKPSQIQKLITAPPIDASAAPPDPLGIARVPPSITTPPQSTPMQSTADVMGASAALPPPGMLTAPAKAQPRHWYDFTQGIDPTTGRTPSYAQAAIDPSTGQPNVASPSLTRLGKVFTLLTMLGKGAAEGSAGRNFGQGFELARQAQAQDIQNYQQQQAQGLNTQMQRMKLAQMPWEIARQREMSDLQLESMRLQQKMEQAKLTGVNSWQYSRDENGELQAQAYDINRNPIGPPIRNAATKSSKYQQVMVPNPNDPNNPIIAGYDPLTNHVYDQNGKLIPNAEKYVPSVQIQKMPTRMPPEIAAQLGQRPSTTPTPWIYKGQTFNSAAEADAQWGRDFQALRERTSKTVDWKQDVNGEWVGLRKTTVSGQGRIGAPMPTGGAAGGAAPTGGGGGKSSTTVGTGQSPMAVVHTGIYGANAGQMMTGQMPNNGPQVAGSPAELEAAGVKGYTKMPQALQAQALTARNLTGPNGLFSSIDKDLAAFKPGELDGITNRWNEFMTGKFGADDRYIALRTDVNGLLDTAIMGAHGVRGKTIMEKFQKMADAGTFKGSNLKTAIDTERRYMEERAMRVPQNKPSQSNKPTFGVKIQ